MRLARLGITPPSTWHPALYKMAVWRKQLARSVAWRFDGHDYVRGPGAAPLQHLVYRHTSKLIRVAPGVDPALQQGKVLNLDVAMPLIDGAVIEPGQTLSFCRLVGPPTRERGFALGMELAQGRPRAGVGGGLCALANMLHWLTLHSPLCVVERHHHSVDPFPDDGRVLPFGSGATVFYNYLDYRVSNRTSTAFQFRLCRDERQLIGELRAERLPELAYHVFERDAAFERTSDKTFRRNSIWRTIVDRRTGRTLTEERLYLNRGEVLYPLPSGYTGSR